MALPAAVEASASLSELSFSPGARESLCPAQEVVQCHTLAEMERFITSRDSLPIHLRGFLFPYDLESYRSQGARLFLTRDGHGGVALINGELASLFSLPGAHYGDMLVRFAIAQGACKLSCFDAGGKLPYFYSRHGFREVVRAAWNDDYAPKTWNYAIWGRPDYVEMIR